MSPRIDMVKLSRQCDGIRGEPVRGGSKVSHDSSLQVTGDVPSGLFSLWVKMKHSRYHLGYKDKNRTRHQPCQHLFLYLSTLRKWEQINVLLFTVIQSKILGYSHTIWDNPLPSRSLLACFNCNLFYLSVVLYS